ncbi:MAG: hypothetical protein FWE91_08830 [Defluviitaleaceae bacterium]|nr:hypothetical protein [Defluviitaleaceae bacterium]MCL2836035.1 hypothetical protein [Defluviitaleaceae bacterium]
MSRDEEARKKFERTMGKVHTERLFRFFENIKKSDYEVIILVSRKAYILYLVWRLCGCNLDGKHVYSDRVINKVGRYEKELFRGKKVLLVDDAVRMAAKLSVLLATLRDKFECAAISVYVYARNVSGKIEDGIAERLFCMVDMCASEMEEFSLRQVHAIQTIGLVYYIETPISRINTVSSEEMAQIEGLIEKIHNGGTWIKERHEVKLLDALKPDNILEDKYLLVASDKAVTSPWPTFSQHVGYSFVSYSDGYMVSFVPFVALDCFDFDSAKYFMECLRDDVELSRNGNLAEFIEMALGDGLERNVVCVNYQRAVNCILNHCLGFKFFNMLREQGLSDALYNKMVYGLMPPKAHFGANFNDFIKGLKFEDVAKIEGILERMQGMFQLEEGQGPFNGYDRIDDYFQFNDIEDLEGHPELELVKMHFEDVDPLRRGEGGVDYAKVKAHFGVLMQHCKGRNTFKSKPVRVVLSHAFQNMGLDRDAAGICMRKVVVPLMEESVCSSDSFYTRTRDGKEWGSRALIAGENSIKAAYIDIPPVVLNALFAFKIAVGGYERMRENLRGFIENLRPIWPKDVRAVFNERNFEASIRLNYNNEQKFLDIVMKGQIEGDEQGVSPLISNDECNREADALGCRISSSPEV